MGRRFRVIFMQILCPRGRLRCCGGCPNNIGSSTAAGGSRRGSSRRGEDDRLIGVGTSLLWRRQQPNHMIYITCRRSRDVTVHHSRSAGCLDENIPQMRIEETTRKWGNEYVFRYVFLVQCGCSATSQKEYGDVAQGVNRHRTNTEFLVKISTEPSHIPN